MGARIFVRQQCCPVHAATSELVQPCPHRRQILWQSLERRILPQQLTRQGKHLLHKCTRQESPESAMACVWLPAAHCLAGIQASTEALQRGNVYLKLLLMLLELSMAQGSCSERLLCPFSCSLQLLELALLSCLLQWQSGGEGGILACHKICRRPLACLPAQ